MNRVDENLDNLTNFVHKGVHKLRRKNVCLPCLKYKYTPKVKLYRFFYLQGAGTNLEALMAGRFFLGMSLGMEGSIHCMYVCELVSKKYRGPMAASSVVIINFGFLLMYILGSSLYWQVGI